MADLTGADGGLRELALFAGAGGGILGGHLLGWRTVVAVERDAYAAQVLAQRQNDGALRPFPIWSDVCSFDGTPWRGLIDVVSGGFPCQDISLAGAGDGLDGARSGLWREFKRVVRDVRPGYVYVENSPALTSRGLGIVLGDLASLGFNAKWGVVSAADTGAPHLRERIWILANAHGVRELQPPGGQCVVGNGFGHCGEALADTCIQRHGQQKEAICAGRNAVELGGSDVADPDREPRDEGRSNNATEITGGRDADRGSFCKNDVGHGHGQGLAQRQGQSGHARPQQSPAFRAGGWPPEPGVGRIVDGLADGLDFSDPAAKGGI